MARWEGLGGGWEWACLRPPCSSSSPPTSAHQPAPRGKRGWKNFHGILKGMILYLQKVRGQPKGVGLGWLRGFGGWAGTELWPGQDGHPTGGVPAWESAVGGRA